MITWPEFAEALRRCASGPAVAVHVAGRPGGLVRLRAGAVLGAWTTGTPLSVPSPDPTGPLARLAMTDAVFVMAAGPVAALRVEDDPAAVNDPVGMGLEALIAEVDRRMRWILRPGGPPLWPEETVVRRLERPAPVRLTHTPRERALLEAVGPGRDTVRTVRDLAFALGRGVFAVLLDVQRLATMGALALTTHPVAERRSEHPTTVRRAPDGIAFAAAPRARPVEPTPPRPMPAVLARRVPGATAMARRGAAWHRRRPPAQPPDDRTDGQP